MKRVRTVLAHRYPYPHEHSRDAVVAVLLASLFFISTDNLHTLIHKLEDNIKWWSIYACLLGFFYFFSSPFFGRAIRPSYTNFSRWYITWLLLAAVYHLPSFQSMGVDVRMSLSLFLTVLLASIATLVAFHVLCVGAWHLGLIARLHGERPEILTILQNSVVVSIACCVFYSHCGNRAGPEGDDGAGGGAGPGNHARPPPAVAAASSSSSWTFRSFKDEICSTWLAPVGSAHDYPTFSHLALYGERVLSSDSNAVPSDIISPVYSLWATFIGLYMANYVVERSSGWALTHPPPPQPANGSGRTADTEPDFLPMVPWYSGTSADLIKTAFNLLVSVTLFLGRFDMRMMQAAMSSAQQQQQQQRGDSSDGFTYRHLKSRKDLWFDFVADTGDGGDPTYAIARLLAQPTLTIAPPVTEQGPPLSLPRARLLLIGGDLAYPSPTPASYEQRLFRPYEYALQPPPCYHPNKIAVRKPDHAAMQRHDGPECFAIPGNHDWFDGLDTFLKYICHKSWLGGWVLPQQHSYFALQLPHNWWVFGFDQALHSDIDILQFKYFSTIAEEQVGPDDSVLIVTHEPNWLLDWFWGGSTGTNVTLLIEQHLRGRCRVRFAGDLHHYMRHSSKQPTLNDNHSTSPTTATAAAAAAEHAHMQAARAHSHHSASPSSSSLYSSPFPSPSPLASSSSSSPSSSCEHLVVSGGGGAFLHPTHVFADFDNLRGTPYERKGCYPPIAISKRLSLQNILKFRKMNWQFDVVGGIAYFVLVFSLFPRCNVTSVLHSPPASPPGPGPALSASFPAHVLSAVGVAAAEMLQRSYVSAAGAAALWALAVLFVPRGRSSGARAKIALGTLHFLAHLLCALTLMVLMEVGVEICVRHQLMGTSGFHSLYRWYRAREQEHFPDPTGLRARMEEWTMGLYPACIKYLMAAFDVPEVMAVARNTICRDGMAALPRWVTLVYYATVFLYYWVFSTPVVSLVFGCYLYISINWFHLHLDEAFSSLRIANYKSFLRCHITEEGDLEVFSLAIDKVPKEWTLDPGWEVEQKIGGDGIPSYKRDCPSKWAPAPAYRDRPYHVRMIDHFVVKHRLQKEVHASSSSGGSPTGSRREESPVHQEEHPSGLLRRTSSFVLMNGAGRKSDHVL